MVDESLEILTGLWSGEQFSDEGEHYRPEEMTVLPGSVQRPRIPDPGCRRLAGREVRRRQPP